jgi:hypothetical protein
MYQNFKNYIIFRLEYNNIISCILKTTFRTEYGNMNESVRKSISEIVINEMKISLDTIKPNPWAETKRNIVCGRPMVYKIILRLIWILSKIFGIHRFLI